MGASLNLVFFIGNITQDPILRTTPGGKSVCNFGLAVNDPYGGDTLYLECESWDKRGEAIAKFCVKGSSLHISGKMTVKRWTDATTGAKRSKTIIVVSDAQFLSRQPDTPPSGNQLSDPGKSNARRMAPPPTSDDTKDTKPEEDDNVPF